MPSRAEPQFLDERQGQLTGARASFLDIASLGRPSTRVKETSTLDAHVRREVALEDLVRGRSSLDGLQEPCADTRVTMQAVVMIIIEVSQ